MKIRKVVLAAVVLLMVGAAAYGLGKAAGMNAVSTVPETMPADETKPATEETRRQGTTAAEDEETTKESLIPSNAAAETPSHPAAAETKDYPTAAQPDATEQTTAQETDPETMAEIVPETVTETSTEAVTPLYIRSAWLDFTPTQFVPFGMEHYHIEVVMSDGTTVTDPDGFTASPLEFTQMLTWVYVAYGGSSYQFEVYARPNLGE